MSTLPGQILFVPSNVAAPPVAGAALPGGASTPAIVPEASEGFHDLKPLPEFSPLPVTLLWSLFLLMLAAALLFWAYRRYKEPPRLPAPPPPIKPDQSALDEIQALDELRKSGAINVRELSARLSLCLRRYLEASLTFSASEQTTTEVLRALGPALKAAFPACPPERLANCFQAVRSLLKFCERVTFEQASEQAFTLDSGTFVGQLGSAKNAVTAIESLLTEERQRALEQAKKRAMESTSFDGGPNDGAATGGAGNSPPTPPFDGTQGKQGKRKELTR